MPMLADYKVTYRREESIADAALRARRVARNENFANFNIVKFVEDILLPKIKRPFEIKFFNTAEEGKPAYVCFNPCELHIDYEIWDLARIGEPQARYIVAHEIGHLLLHDHNAKAFSIDPASRIKAWEPEYSAEWQANIFAFYFLLPTHVVAAYSDAKELAAAASVPESVALARLDALRARNRPHAPQVCGLCPSCGNFSILANGKCVSSGCV